MTKLDNDKLAIITNGGGLGVITVDSCMKKSIRLAKLPDSLLKKISKLLPGNPKVGNPVDVIGDADTQRFQKVLDIVLESKEVGLALVIVTPQAMTEIVETAELMMDRCNHQPKPILTSFIGKEKRMKVAFDVLNEGCLPNFEFPELAVNAIQMLNDYNSFRKKGRNFVEPPKLVNLRPYIQKALDEGRSSLSLEEGFELLKQCNLELPEQLFSNKLDDHLAFFNKHRSVVLKIDSPEVLHKTETKLISRKITDAKTLEEEFFRIEHGAHKLRNAKVCSQAFVHGTEMIVGGLRDVTFGPVISVGFGGIMTEITKDVTFRVAPVTDSEVHNMLEELKAHKLLEGYRGMPKADTKAIVDAVQAISSLMLSLPEIKEIELNPLIVGAEGSITLPVDILVKLG